MNTYSSDRGHRGIKTPNSNTLTSLRPTQKAIIKALLKVRAQETVNQLKKKASATNPATNPIYKPTEILSSLVQLKVLKEEVGILV